MKIIISPAKRMQEDTDSLPVRGEALFPQKTAQLVAGLRGLSLEELTALLRCSEKLAAQNYRRYQAMDGARQRTPALFAYQGIQYQYMLPTAFTQPQYDYLQEHLYILSGLYGLLRPFDGVLPYRLEMQARLRPDYSLYDFWGQTLGHALSQDNALVIDLASEEYSKAARQGVSSGVRWVTVRFGEVTDGRFREKGTQIKMARGAMVRYMAEQQVTEPEGLRGFAELGYRFSEERSQEDQLVFCKV